MNLKASKRYNVNFSTPSTNGQSQGCFFVMQVSRMFNLHVMQIVLQLCQQYYNENTLIYSVKLCNFRL